ncbi:MAG TPA: HAMP domain-containing sensor histidine kinase [Chloroflexota bacterium]|nr:HAMP domain-containing sensor histidine kinase [Chloroflexota bacterium]
MGFFAHLKTIRGRLVVWYLAILVVLLAGLGIFQIVTLRDYLRSSLAANLRTAAHSELSVLGPCYVQSAAALRHSAPTLARLLGGHDTAAAIVTPGGAILANRGLGFSGASHPLHLTASTIRSLIGNPTSNGASGPPIHVTACPRPLPVHSRPGALSNGHRTDTHRAPPWASGIVSSGGLLLVAMRLGPPGTPVGYAILGRSSEDAAATVARAVIAFLIGAIAVVLVAALVALPIINRALRPLRRMTTAAEAIAAGHLEERAQVSESPDEVGRLGEAFDTMVDRLQEAMAASVESEQRMRRFLADASHELRTPVTVLRGASQVLLRQTNTQDLDVRAGLRDLHEEAVRLSRLIDDLLTLNRIDAGQPLAPQPVEVRPFLADFVDRYSVAWPGRSVRVAEGNLNGAEAQVDPEALRRIMANLVENAARYSRPDGAITITGHAAAQSIEVAVADEGPGLTPEDAAQVFDRFYRVNKSRSRNSGGTGLGLAIVEGLVTESGGTIHMDTGPERGTTVTVTLPRATRSGRARS